MTGFGIYLAIYMALNILASIYYAGRGGLEHTPGTLWLAAIWSAANLAGILLFGTGAL